MNHSYERVIALLKSIDAHTVYHGYRSKYFQRSQPILYASIINFTADITQATFTERLYCYANSLKQRPLCKICTNTVTYQQQAYHTYCSQRCAMRDMKTLLGVDNASQLDSVKQKKKQRAIEKYGVDNVSKDPVIRKTISHKVKQYWSSVFPTETGAALLSEKEYYKLVTRYSERTFRNFKHIIDPLNLRGRQFHLDHRVSVKHGFINRVPPHIIGDIVNLELIPATQNTSKSYRNSITVEQLLLEYQTKYQSTTYYDINDDQFKRSYKKASHQPHAKGMTCKYCGNNAEYLHVHNNIWQCKPSHNSCPAMRAANSRAQQLKKSQQNS